MNEWVRVTTEELAGLVEVLDRALSSSLNNDNEVWLKIEGSEVLFTIEDPAPKEDPETTKRLAAARAAWRELKAAIAEIPEAEVIEVDGEPV